MFVLLIRSLVVVLLSFALSSSPINDEVSRLFVFMAGVFPLRALEAIAKRVNITVDPDFPSDGPGSFDGIPSLDPAKVFALRAAGIQSTYDLAAIEKVLEDTNIKIASSSATCSARVVEGFSTHSSLARPIQRSSSNCAAVASRRVARC